MQMPEIKFEYEGRPKCGAAYEVWASAAAVPAQRVVWFHDMPLIGTLGATTAKCFTN